MIKTVLVTGGTKGIGKAVCTRLLLEGWRVVLTYAADDEAANSFLKELNSSMADRVNIIKADCTDLSAIDKIEAVLHAENLSLDAVIFNAGLTDRSDFLEISPETWDAVFRANVDFPVFLLQRLYSRLNEQGCIVFTGSQMAIHPHAMSLAYGVSKASVHALVKNLVKFFVTKRIRVNAVAPGFVETNWHLHKPETVRNSINSKIAVGRFCAPEEIADVYVLLLNNTYMNGEIVECDGGYNYK